MLTSLFNRLPLPKGLVDFMYPPICAGCGSYFEAETGVCDDCRDRIDWSDQPAVLSDINFRPGAGDDSLQPDSFPLFAAGSYSDPLREIIIQYKFKGITGPAALVARRLTAEFEKKIQKLAPAVLIPIPLHPSREYVRGYNQATLFARELSRLLDMPMDDRVILRVKKRKPQSKLRKSKRAGNIRSVFELAPGAAETEGLERLILVDDVVTSGQTMFEARRVLTQAGLQVVGAIAMAHKV